MKHGILSSSDAERYSHLDRILRRFRSDGPAKGLSIDETSLARDLAKHYGVGPGNKLKLFFIKSQQGDGISWLLQSLVDRTQQALADGRHYSVMPWRQTPNTPAANSVSAELLADRFALNNLWRWLFILRHGTWRQRCLGLLKLLAVVVALYVAGAIGTYALSREPMGLPEFFSSFPFSRHLLFLCVSLLLAFAGAYFIDLWRMQGAAEGRLSESHFAFLRNDPSGDFAPLCSAYRSAAGFYPILNIVDAADRLGEFDQKFIYFLIARSGEWRQTAVAWLIAYTDSDSQFIKLLRASTETGSDRRRFDVFHYDLQLLSAAERVHACELHNRPIDRATTFSTLHDLVRGPDSAEEERLNKRWQTFLYDNGEDEAPSPQPLQQQDRMSVIDLVKYLSLSIAYAPQGFTPKEIARVISDRNPEFVAHAQMRSWKPHPDQEALSLLLKARQAGEGLISKRNGYIVISPDIRPIIEAAEKTRRNDTEFIHFFWASHYSKLWERSQSLDDFERLFFHLSRSKPLCPGMDATTLEKSLDEYLKATLPVARQLLRACRFRHLSELLAQTLDSLSGASLSPSSKFADQLGLLLEIACDHFFFTGLPEIVSTVETTVNRFSPPDQSGAREKARMLLAYKDLVTGHHSDLLKREFVSANPSPTPGGSPTVRQFLYLECALQLEFGLLNDLIRSGRQFSLPSYSSVEEVSPIEYRLRDRLAHISIYRGDFHGAVQSLENWAIRCDDLRKKIGPYDLLQRALLRLYLARLVHLLLDIRAGVPDFAAPLPGQPIDPLASVREELLRQTLEIAKLARAQVTDVPDQTKQTLGDWVLDEYNQAVALADLLDLQFAVVEGRLGRGLYLKDHSAPWSPNIPGTWKDWDEDLRAVVHVEHNKQICRRSPDALLARITALGSVPSLILTDALAYFRLTRDFSFARKAQIFAYNWMQRVITSAGKGQMLEALIEASLWWIKQIEDDPLVLNDSWLNETEGPAQEIIGTYLYVSQYARFLHNLSDAKRYLEEAENRFQLLSAEERQSPSLILDLELQKIWLQQAQKLDSSSAVDALFLRQGLRNERMFGYVVDTKLGMAPDPLDRDLFEQCLFLLQQNIGRYHNRPFARAAVYLARKGRQLANHDEFLHAEITGLLSRIVQVWTFDRIPTEMINLYAALRDYDKVNRPTYQIELDSWVATELRGDDLLRTEALYDKGNFVEVLELLIQAFRFHATCVVANSVVKQARVLLQADDFNGCLKKLGEVDFSSLSPFIVHQEGQTYLALDRFDFLRLKAEALQKMGETLKFQPVAAQLQSAAKKYIPELLNTLVSSASLGGQLKETIQVYIEIHEKFP